MKTVFSVLLFVLMPVFLTAQNIYPVVTDGENWVENQPVEGMFQPPTRFTVRCDDDGLRIDVMFLMEDASPIASRPGRIRLEIGDCVFSGIIRNTPPFPRKLLEGNRFGIVCTPRMEIMPDYFRADAVPLRSYQVKIDFLPHTTVLHFQFPWNDLLTMTPFDEAGRGRKIPFRLFRTSYGKESGIWDGALQMPDRTDAEMLRHYRTAVLKACERHHVVRWYFDPASLDVGMEKLADELAAYYARIPADPAELTLTEWRKRFTEVQDLAAGFRVRNGQNIVYGTGFNAPAPDSAAPLKNGMIPAPYLAKHQKHIVHLLSAPPAIVWYGAVRLSALEESVDFQKFAQTLPIVCCAVPGDDLPGIRWRVENSVLPQAKPGYFVLYADPGTMPEPSFAALLTAIRKTLPETEILLLASGDPDFDRIQENAADPEKKIRFVRPEKHIPEQICSAVEQVLVRDLERSMETKDRPRW